MFDCENQGCLPAAESFEFEYVSQDDEPPGDLISDLMSEAFIPMLDLVTSMHEQPSGFKLDENIVQASGFYCCWVPLLSCANVDGVTLCSWL